jgi:hypothetical protein
MNCGIRSIASVGVASARPSGFFAQGRSRNLRCHDAIVPLFCPTGQANFVKSVFSDLETWLP